MSVSEIHIQFTRFSAFYTPLIATIAGGFLRDQGLSPRHSISPPGVSAIDALVAGTAQVVQSAPSQGISVLENGGTPPALHFAQINEMDGFFLSGRRADPEFRWQKLAGRRVLVDHGGQPLAMFKYACHRMGLAFDAFDAVDAGGAAQMDRAFRDGDGDFIHQQGPAPQMLEHDGVGHVLASVGEAIGPCAFSSLAATPEWLRGDQAKAFMRAYRKARAYVNRAGADEIAAAEAGFFPEVPRQVLTRTIAFYQGLGCWAPHVEITRAAYAATLDVFLHAGRITKRHPYDRVIAAPPDG